MRVANAESYVGAKLPNGPFMRYETGVALNMGSSVLRTVAALFPALILSLRALRSRGLLESTILRERDEIKIFEAQIVFLQTVH